MCPEVLGPEGSPHPDHKRHAAGTSWLERRGTFYFLTRMRGATSVRGGGRYLPDLGSRSGQKKTDDSTGPLPKGQALEGAPTSATRQADGPKLMHNPIGPRWPQSIGTACGRAIWGHRGGPKTRRTPCGYFGNNLTLSAGGMDTSSYSQEAIAVGVQNGSAKNTRKSTGIKPQMQSRVKKKKDTLQKKTGIMPFK